MQFFFLYIDPGSGSMLIQLLIGMAVAVGIFFRKIKFVLMEFFKKKDKPSAIEEED
jgi:F0F1-type ATP synthase assembly protein I